MAIPRFSYLVVAVGKMPPGVNTLLGKLSPLKAFIGCKTFLTKSGTGFGDSAVSLASAQDAGYFTSRMALMAESTACQFILTIFSPLAP